jgi:catechol 2,3-dioxygenase-like lactoylglutathione lyase family enzyme
MNLRQTRLITHDLPRLTRFYESVTGAAATPVTGTYVEFKHDACEGLAIADVAALRAYDGNIAEPAANIEALSGLRPSAPVLRSTILDFEVDDVDAEYDRLRGEVADWVQLPKTMPWGNRAMLFRDPDGNLINIFARVRQTEAA